MAARSATSLMPAVAGSALPTLCASKPSEYPASSAALNSRSTSSSPQPPLTPPHRPGDRVG